jgi:hypothetical protein
MFWREERPDLIVVCTPGRAVSFMIQPSSATGYVSKYVTKDFGDWELIGNFVPMAERQLTLIR